MIQVLWGSAYPSELLPTLNIVTSLYVWEFPPLREETVRYLVAMVCYN